ncbi:hypothetical protein LTR37_007909 [Vermiconidia calcicola]|uniref:Uncharacterized protein n=1 Tax=Vermiconidia calcicola TaxID=1690605 RepID=A0ACC3NCB2_9PEZI|nr:hypothetical protein LTR37_007909 [Vermiconidia calcicola]
MAPTADGALTFEIHFSFSLNIGNHISDHWNRPAPPSTNELPRSFDISETSLSPTTRQLQRRLREQAQPQHKRERSSDAESLQLLEAATAAISRTNDRNSLDLLMRHTLAPNVKKEAKPKQSVTFSTPEKTSFWPTFRRITALDDTPLSDLASFTTPSDIRRELEARSPPLPNKGLNDTPRSYAPSFSTPSPLKRELEAPKAEIERNESKPSFTVGSTTASELETSKSGKEVNGSRQGNEFENFLLKDQVASQGDKIVPTKSKRNSFSALLASSGAEVSMAKTMDSKYIKKQANSVFEWMDKLEKRDIEAEVAMREDLAEAMVSPVNSPTSAIKHLPMGYDTPSTQDEEADNAENNDEEAKDPAVGFEDNSAVPAHGGGEGGSGSGNDSDGAKTAKEELSDDEDEWEMLE